jgi:hypothetical protein
VTARSPVRSWVRWTIVATWVFTGATVLVLSLFHLPSPVDLLLHLKEVSFETDSSDLLGPSDQENFVISGVTNVSFQGSGVNLNASGTHRMLRGNVTLRGDMSSSCTFSKVRVNPIQPMNRSILTLLWQTQADGPQLAVRSHGSLNGSLTARPAQQLTSGFSCIRVSLNGEPPADVDASFIRLDAVSFSTASDTQLDFRNDGNIDFEETQIRVLSNLRLSHTEPGGPPRETTVLLPPLPGEKNTISFPRVNKVIEIGDADLITIRPTKNFYLKRFSVDRGIQVAFSGEARDVRVGAGPEDLRSVMPSIFDDFDNQKRLFAVIPGIVALIIGVLEKLGLLKTAQK